MDNLLKAKETLKEGYTCVFVSDTKTLTSTERGVKPLIDFLNTKTDFSQFCAADKVVGKGAAFLYVILKIKRLHAVVISSPALDILEKNGIEISYDTLCENIKNRRGDGLCPMEEATLNITEPKQALVKILEKLGELK